MYKGNLTREQAVEIVGESLVDSLDKENCDFTNRVGFNGSTQGDGEVEFAASVIGQDKSGDEVTVVAYYYQDAEAVDATDDLGSLDWKIEGYKVI